MLRRFFADPAALKDMADADLVTQFRQAVQQLSPAGANILGDDWIPSRLEILAAIGSMALRDRDTYARELRVVLNDAVGLGSRRANDLQRLSWDVFYTELICSQLARGEVRAIAVRLPDMVDPALPAVQRTLLFDMLKMWMETLKAAEQVVDVVGQPSQQTAMGRFMSAVKLFVDTFTPNPPPPGLIAQIAQFFGIVTNQIDDLRAAVASMADALESVTYANFFGLDDDANARNVVSELFVHGRVALVAFGLKTKLLQAMLDGPWVGDEDEQGVLRILSETKKQSVSAFAELVAGAQYLKIDGSLEGQEYDDLQKLFNF